MIRNENGLAKAIMKGEYRIELSDDLVSSVIKEYTMKCPYCGSKRVQGTNVGERVFANVCAFGAGLIGHLAGPAGGVIAERETQKAICPYAKYICLDCKKEFQESRAH